MCPDSKTLTIRPTTMTDFGAVDALLARSYPVLLKADYKPSVMVTALPMISKAQSRLLRCGTYFLAEDEAGQVLAAGGWTRTGPGGRAGRPSVGHIRHVVTDHRATRQGIGRALMEHVLGSARAAGVETLDCLSTLTAVPFYGAMGFQTIGAVELSLAPGIRFPAVQMELRL